MELLVAYLKEEKNKIKQNNYFICQMLQGKGMAQRPPEDFPVWEMEYIYAT